MALLNRINEDLKLALKSQDETQITTLRLLLAAIRNREIEKRAKDKSAELTDEEVMVLIKKEAKKRKEAMEIYGRSGREELAKKETAELKILEKYLPVEASEAEMEAVVKQTMGELKPTSEKDFGRIMKGAMAKLQGRGDASYVSQMVKRYMSSE